ncbi:MAG: hypothetical protein R3E68_09990 [Burkholderiaceae bacterium]
MKARGSRSAFAPALLLAAATATPASACPLTESDGTLLTGETVTAAWQLPGGPVRMSTPFSLIVRACPADSDLVGVDATMPAHRHGMNYAPSITELEPGRWRVDGLLWHMAGQWELTLDLRPGGSGRPIERLRQAVVLP